MTHSEIAKIVGTKLGIEPQGVEAVFRACLNEIQTATAAGQIVQIAKFGTFRVTTMASRSGTAPNGVAFTTEPKDILKFKASR